MATLIDSLTNLITPAVGQIAGKLGESETAVSSGVTGSLGAMLGGLLHKSTDTSAFGQIFDVIGSAPPSANLAGDLETAVGAIGKSRTLVTDTATNFLGMLFDGKTSAVTDLLGGAAGFKNKMSAAALLKLAVPMVINFLGKKIRDEGLNAGGLTNLLSSERDSITAAAPRGLTNILDSAPQTPHVERELRRPAVPADRPYVGDTRTEGGGRWLWPAVGVTAAILLWIAVSVSRPHRVEQKMSANVATMDTLANRASGVIDTSGGEVSPTISGLGAIGKRRLPNGIVIDVPAYGTESRVIAFIEGSQPAGEHNAFDLDRLSFAQGSAQLLPESQEQLNTIASILSAYPGVHVKIAGYSDNAGSPVTNLKLSQQRANAVKQALVSSGISSSRMRTEAGSVKHQRVALEITHPSSR
jgi:OmpA-OmpF porin, OOP family